MCKQVSHLREPFSAVSAPQEPASLDAGLADERVLQGARHDIVTQPQGLNQHPKVQTPQQL